VVVNNQSEIRDEWTRAELSKIETAEELRIQSMRRDGTLRNPVIIWVVRLGDRLFVRSIKGPTGPWFSGARRRRQGHIRAAGVDKDVSFVFIDANDGVNNDIDAAYRTKYRRYAGPVLDTVLTPAARAATIELLPRSSAG
jgi:hypothetical protein